MGESFLKSSLNTLLGVNISPVCTRLPATPARPAASITPRISGAPAFITYCSTAWPPPPSTLMESGWAMKGSMATARLRDR